MSRLMFEVQNGQPLTLGLAFQSFVQVVADGWVRFTVTVRPRLGLDPTECATLHRRVQTPRLNSPVYADL